MVRVYQEKRKMFMLNFLGKVIFLAPTKPLVAQQISACSEVMGLKKDDIVELTGKFVCSFQDSEQELQRGYNQGC